MRINDGLKRIIEDLNIDQKELAKIAGVTEGAVSQWLSGTTTPKLGRLQKIALYYNIPLSSLVGEEYPTTLSYNGSTDKTISVDEFTYALCNETKDLTEEQKNLLLSIAKGFKGNR